MTDQPSEAKAIEWTGPGGVSHRLHVYVESWDGLGPHHYRVGGEAAILAAGYSKDNPELDATDGAHPAWWRGHDHTARKFGELKTKLEAKVKALEAERDELEQLVADSGPLGWVAAHDIDGATAWEKRAADLLAKGAKLLSLRTPPAPVEAKAGEVDERDLVPMPEAPDNPGARAQAAEDQKEGNDGSRNNRSSVGQGSRELDANEASGGCDDAQAGVGRGVDAPLRGAERGSEGIGPRDSSDSASSSGRIGPAEIGSAGGEKAEGWVPALESLIRAKHNGRVYEVHGTDSQQRRVLIQEPNACRWDMIENYEPVPETVTGVSGQPSPSAEKLPGGKGPDFIRRSELVEALNTSGNEAMKWLARELAGNR
jgi:hypothetical protein